MQTDVLYGRGLHVLVVVLVMNDVVSRTQTRSSVTMTTENFMSRLAVELVQNCFEWSELYLLVQGRYEGVSWALLDRSSPRDSSSSSAWSETADYSFSKEKSCSSASYTKKEIDCI